MVGVGVIGSQVLAVPQRPQRGVVGQVDGVEDGVGGLGGRAILCLVVGGLSGAIWGKVLGHSNLMDT
jgi:hypothetical protein